MIKACHIFILVLSSISLYAQYVTLGDGFTYSMEDLVSVSGGVATCEDGNYLVHNDLTISSNDILTILEDITVKVAGGKRVTINDTLVVDPPSGSSIDLGATVTYTVTAFHNEERIYTVTAKTEESELFTVVFNVEVGVPQFDPDVHHIMITGTMTNWTEPGTDPDLLMDKISDDPLIYSKTFNLDAGVYEYKYFSNYFGEGWYGGEWPGDPNREIAVSGDMTVEDYIFFHHGSVLFIITDQDDNEIPDATVTLFSGYIGEITNQPGDYFFGWLWIGTYDYIVEKEGYHSVEGTVDVYCCATEEVTLTATDVSVTQQEGTHTRMYPNPASTRFTVSSNENITAIEVISLHGQLIHAASVAGKKHDVVVSGLIPGVYIVRITTGDKELTKRLQVVR